MTKDQLAARIKLFAVDVMRTTEGLPRTRPADVIAKQSIRSVTSVGANYRSACRAGSKPGFVAKLAIAEEEADETQYWIELLFDLKLISEEKFLELRAEAYELTAILAALGKTARANSQGRKKTR